MNQIILESIKEHNNIIPVLDLEDNAANGERAEKRVLSILSSLGFDTFMTNTTTGSSDLMFHKKGHSNCAFGVNVKSTNYVKLVGKKEYPRYRIYLASSIAGKKQISTDCQILAVYFHDIDYVIFLDSKKCADRWENEVQVTLTDIYKDELDIDQILARINAIDSTFSNYFIDLSVFIDDNRLNKVKEIFS